MKSAIALTENIAELEFGKGESIALIHQGTTLNKNPFKILLQQLGRIVVQHLDLFLFYAYGD